MNNLARDVFCSIESLIAKCVMEPDKCNDSQLKYATSTAADSDTRMREDRPASARPPSPGQTEENPFSIIRVPNGCCVL